MQKLQLFPQNQAVIPRQGTDGAVAEPEREIAHSQQRGQHGDAVGKQLVQDGGAQQGEQQRVNQHRGPVKDRELDDPAQQRAFYACQRLPQRDQL